MFSDHYSALARDFFHISHRFQALLMDNIDQPPGSVEASALRSLLRQQLPPNLQVSRGYLCHPNNRSPFLEVIIHNRDGHVWYQEGDLVCLPPEQVRAVLWCLPEEADFSFLVRRSRDMAQLHNWLLAEELPHPPFLGMWVGEQSQMDFEDGLCETIGRLKVDPTSALTVAISWGHWHWMQAEQGMATRVFKQGGVTPEPEIGPMAAWLNYLHYHLMGEQAAVTPDAWFKTSNWRRLPLVEQVAAELNLQAEPVPIRVRPPHQAGQEAEIWAPIAPLTQYQPAQPREEPDTREAAAVTAAPLTALANPLPTPQQRPQQQLPNRRKRSSKHEATPLHQAVETVNLQAIRRGLKAGIHPDNQNPEGNTALHLAAKHDLLEFGKPLIEAGADVNARNFVYATPLHLAVTHPDGKLTAYLLKEGAEVEVRNNRGRTPLHEAAAIGNISAVSQLLDAFANIHALMEKEMQPLHLAAWYGHNEVLTYLIERGAERNAVNIDGNTALHFAAFNGQVKTIKVLMNLQADPALTNQLGKPTCRASTKATEAK